jgi:DNA-binding HxlR family transcriptional regulator
MSEYDYKNINDILHSRIRLAIVSVLVKQEEADFVSLKKTIGATDGNMTTHLRKLEDSDYITVAKEFVERKPVTRYSLTEKGRSAFEEYVSQLESFLKH